MMVMMMVMVMVKFVLHCIVLYDNSKITLLLIQNLIINYLTVSI